MKYCRERNIYLRALFGTMLFCASLHLVLLAIYAITHNQLNLINLFNIIDLDLFFPKIGQSLLSAVLAIITTAAIYFIALTTIKRQSKLCQDNQPTDTAERHNQQRGRQP